MHTTLSRLLRLTLAAALALGASATASELQERQFLPAQDKVPALVFQHMQEYAPHQRRWRARNCIEGQLSGSIYVHRGVPGRTPEQLFKTIDGLNLREPSAAAIRELDYFYRVDAPDERMLSWQSPRSAFPSIDKPGAPSVTYQQFLEAVFPEMQLACPAAGSASDAKLQQLRTVLARWIVLETTDKGVRGVLTFPKENDMLRTRQALLSALVAVHLPTNVVSADLSSAGGQAYFMLWQFPHARISVSSMARASTVTLTASEWAEPPP